MINLLTPQEVSEIIGISLKNTYKLFHLKDFPSIQIGRKLVVKEKDLDEFLDRYKNCQIFF